MLSKKKLALKLKELGTLTDVLSVSDLEDLITAICETIMQSLAEGQNVRIFDFGTFELKKRPARIGVNPKTGAKIKIAACQVPKFKPAQKFKLFYQKKKNS